MIYEVRVILILIEVRR